jgi:hypothetical protein
MAIESDDSPSMGVAPVAHEAVISVASSDNGFWSSTGSEVPTRLGPARASHPDAHVMPAPAPMAAVRRATEEASSKGRLTTGGAATGSIHVLAGADAAGQVAAQEAPSTAPSAPIAVSGTAPHAVAGEESHLPAAPLAPVVAITPAPVAQSVPVAPTPVPVESGASVPVSPAPIAFVAPAPVVESPALPAQAASAPAFAAFIAPPTIAEAPTAPVAPFIAHPTIADAPTAPVVPSASSEASWPTTVQRPAAAPASTPAVEAETHAPAPAIDAPTVSASSFVDEPVVERVDRDLTDAEIGPFTPSWPSVAPSSGSSRPPERVVLTENGEEPSGWLVTSKVADALRIAEEQGSVEEYLDGRGDVIRLHLRLDEAEFRRLTANPGVEQFESWDDETVSQD